MCLGVYLISTVDCMVVGFHYETGEDEKEKSKLADSKDLIASLGDYKIFIYKVPNQKYSKAQDDSSLYFL